MGFHTHRQSGKTDKRIRMKNRLEKAMKEKEKIKLLFEYPNTKSVKVRRGYVKEVGDKSFDFQEDKDGLVTYQYRFLVEIKKEVSSK